VPRWLSARLLLTLIFCGCAGLLAFALYLQHALDLEPCPMCILQRYGFLAAGVLAGLGAVHGPGAVGQRIYAALVGVAALAGGGVAARHTWVEHNPPRIADCGPDLEFMVDSFPLSEALPMIFRGSGDCSKVAWRWLGLSIAEWSLVAFSGILLTAVLIFLIARTPRRR
jgi:disulfide bond formation protein DsbB